MKKNTPFFLIITLFMSACLFFLTGKVENDNSRIPQLITKKQLLAYQNKKIERRNNGYFKQDKPGKYLEYLNFLKSPIGENYSYQFNQNLNELKRAKDRRAFLKSSNVKLNWIERGPGNVGGRTRGFILDPDDDSADTWFAGSVGGGIWKTMDAGNSWECITTDWPNLSIGSLAMAESDHNVIYAGTGEGFGNLDAILGNGIFKSLDKGQTWNLLESTRNNTNFKYINRISVHPTDENTVLVATNNGIYKSIDGGLNWINVFSNNKRIQDLEFNPQNPLQLLATSNGSGIIKSNDGGDHWKLVYTIGEGRIEVSYSVLEPNYIYALSEESNLYLSTDGGDNWELGTTGTKVEFLSAQGWYNNTLVGDPTNKNILWIGGLDVYRVTIGNENSEEGNSVFDINTSGSNIFTYGDIDGQYLMGGLSINDLGYADLNNVEIRFGNSKSQKAHFFTVNSLSDAVVNAENYSYEGYFDVPFEVWDTENNVQLMVSVRDQDENGSFDLSNGSLEQIHIHSMNYNTIESSEISLDGGVENQLAISLFPRVRENVVWNPDNIEDFTISLSKYTLKSRSFSSIKKSDWRTQGTNSYSHADHHNLIITEKAGNPYRIINCNDGGVFISDDKGASWSERVSGYVTTQFYGISRHPNNNIYLGGTQDNGTWISGENSDYLSSWNKVAGGDGFETVWHSIDENKLAISLYYNSIYTTIDGQNFVPSSDIGDTESGNAPFVTQIANCISNPDLLLVGGNSGLWRSPDFGQTWDLIRMPETTWEYGSYSPRMSISPADGQIIWAGTFISQNTGIAVSTDGGLTFSEVNAPLQRSTRLAISNIVAHPTEPQTAFILCASGGVGKIYKTDDLGESWNELTGFGGSSTSSNGFPDVAVYDMIVMPYNPDIIWVGTEIGLFESTDGGQNWLYADNGLPAVCIWDMKIVNQQVIVGTHGRGVWTLDVPEIQPAIKPPYIKQAAKKPNGEIWYKALYSLNLDSVKIYLEGELWETKIDVSSGEEIYSIGDYNNSALSFELKIVGYSDMIQYTSNVVKVSNPNLGETIEKYSNSFSSRKYDFKGTSFTITKNLFDDYGIHSPHSYAEKTEYTYTLNHPIRVLEDADKAIMEFRDIALVEPGEQGTKYGDEEFWDYVIVEATIDGANWIPLMDGYDVNYSAKWKDFADNNKSDNEFDYEGIENEPNSKELFESHTIRLHDTFNAGDIIQIRFRLHSDDAAVGWGWVIDDVVIQEEGTGIASSIAAKDDLLIVPNPAQDFITIKLNSESKGDVTVNIYDLSGNNELRKEFHKDIDMWYQELDISALESGVKILKLAIDEGEFTSKFIKK
nr:T9SS type A sorting domain-containing protein [uncultured Carboxylicivirga sp.]